MVNLRYHQGRDDQGAAVGLDGFEKRLVVVLIGGEDGEEPARVNDQGQELGEAAQRASLR